MQNAERRRRAKPAIWNMEPGTRAKRAFSRDKRDTGDKNWIGREELILRELAFSLYSSLASPSSLLRIRIVDVL